MNKFELKYKKSVNLRTRFLISKLKTNNSTNIRLKQKIWSWIIATSSNNCKNLKKIYKFSNFSCKTKKMRINHSENVSIKINKNWSGLRSKSLTWKWNFKKRIKSLISSNLNLTEFDINCKMQSISMKKIKMKLRGKFQSCNRTETL